MLMSLDTATLHHYTTNVHSMNLITEPLNVPSTTIASTSLPNEHSDHTDFSMNNSNTLLPTADLEDSDDLSHLPLFESALVI
jgi:hypothetical protein